MEVKIYKRFQDINAEEVKEIDYKFLNSSETSESWFMFLEETLCDYEPLYCIGKKNGEVLYFSTGYLIKKLDIGTYLTGALKKGVNSLNKVNLNPLKFKVVFIANPLSSFNGIHGENEHFLTDFLEKCKNKIYEEINCDSVFVSNVYDELLNQKLQENDFIRIPFYPNTELNTNYSSFNDYLQSLKKKKRWDVKNKQKVLQEYGAQISILNGDEVEDYARIYELYNNTSSKDGSIPNLINYSRASFDNWSNMNNCYKWVIITYQQQIIAFALIVENDKSLIFKHVGMDYEHSTACFAYFNLYFASIQYAIDNGMKRMYCGPTTYETKKSIGCELIDVNSFISIKNKFFGKFVIRILDKVFSK